MPLLEQKPRSLGRIFGGSGTGSQLAGLGASRRDHLLCGKLTAEVADHIFRRGVDRDLLRRDEVGDDLLESAPERGIAMVGKWPCHGELIRGNV